MFCCQGSVCSRLRHDLAGDPSPTRNPAHEAQAGWREREIGQRMATRVHCSTSHQVQPSFIQSDGCRPFQPQFKPGRRGFKSFVEAQGDSCSRSCCSWWWVPMLRKLEIMGTGCLGGRGLPSASPQRHGSQFVCFLLTLRLTTAFRPHKLSASVSQQTDKACVTNSKALQANRKKRSSITKRKHCRCDCGQRSWWRASPCCRPSWRTGATAPRGNYRTSLSSLGQFLSYLF